MFMALWCEAFIDATVIIAHTRLNSCSEICMNKPNCINSIISGNKWGPPHNRGSNKLLDIKLVYSENRGCGLQKVHHMTKCAFGSWQQLGLDYV